MYNAPQSCLPACWCRYGFPSIGVNSLSFLQSLITAIAILIELFAPCNNPTPRPETQGSCQQITPPPPSGCFNTWKISDSRTNFSNFEKPPGDLTPAPSLTPPLRGRLTIRGSAWCVSDQNIASRNMCLCTEGTPK